MSTIDRIREAADDIQQAEFEPYEEEAIISLAFDHPEFFSGVGRFLQPQMFIRPECKAVLAEILELYEKHNVIPRREMVRDHIHKWITEDHDWESILGVLERPSDPRDVPLVKDTLLEWARHKAYSLLFTIDAQDAYARKDYQYLEELLNQANRIADIGQRGFWFFENFETLFDPDVIDHRTTGFPTLDKYLNNGGPSPKEVVCWLAATNVGKCHSSQTLIIEEELSRIYELELEDGSVIKLRGSHEVQTTRGTIKVKDLTESDNLTEIPVGDDTWVLELPDM